MLPEENSVLKWVGWAVLMVVAAVVIFGGWKKFFDHTDRLLFQPHGATKSTMVAMRYVS